MAEMKYALGMVLLGNIINKNIDCLITGNVDFLLKSAITYQTIVNVPCVLCAFVNYLEFLWCSTQMLLW